MPAITFRQSVPRLGIMNFSRSGKLVVADQTRKGELVSSFMDPARILSRCPDSAMLIGADALPDDIATLFKSAGEHSIRYFDRHAIDFYGDLITYCGLVGFVPRLLIEFPGGMNYDVPACNYLPVKEGVEIRRMLNSNMSSNVSANERDLFYGGFAEKGNLRSIFFGHDQTRDFGSILSSLFLAHEIACIKMEEQAVSIGLKPKDISKEAEKFYTYAYSYAFAHYLISHFKETEPFLIDNPNKDILSLLYNYKAYYDQMVPNMLNIRPDERNRYVSMMVSPQAPIPQFGYPMQVEFAALKVEPHGPIKRLPLN